MYLSPMPRERFATLPNALSLSRIALAVAFALAGSTAVRVAIVIVASASDWLDGWLARRAGTASRWGALLDPITDRVFALTAVSVFLYEGALDTVEYFVLLSRDLMTAIGFLVARVVTWLRTVEFRARLIGKAVTVLQLATLFVLLLASQWTGIMVAAVGIASVAAVADYTLALWRERARPA
jgi:cardiolipin synthase